MHDVFYRLLLHPDMSTHELEAGMRFKGRSVHQNYSKDMSRHFGKYTLVIKMTTYNFFGLGLNLLKIASQLHFNPWPNGSPELQDFLQKNPLITITSQNDKRN